MTSPTSPPSPDAEPAPKTLTIRHFLLDEAPDAFEQALRLRVDVFVAEQGVPFAEERDGYDDEARHWLIMDAETREPLATGRMFPYQEGCQMRPVAKIARIAVSRMHRGRRLGERLMDAIVTHVREEGYEQAILHAQTRVMPFYGKLGFMPEGDEFEENGIPHYVMRLFL